jgi:hypothetical protein
MRTTRTTAGQLLGALAAAAVAALLAQEARGATTLVTTGDELAAAVASSRSGDEIVLAASARMYAPARTLLVEHDLTIRGPDGAPGARLTGAGLEGASDAIVVADGARLTLRSVSLETVPTDGVGIAVSGRLVLEHAALVGNAGSGLFVQQGGTAILRNSTVSDNLGVGVIAHGDAELVSTTVAANGQGGVDNPLGAVTLVNTIVAGNGAGGRKDCTERVAGGARSLDSDGSCGVALGGRDVKLGLLADNGGPTPTRALLAGSPAIDAAADCASVDQRFAPRAGACDIGAFELGSAPSASPGASSGPTSGSQGPGGGGTTAVPGTSRALAPQTRPLPKVEIATSLVLRVAGALEAPRGWATIRLVVRSGARTATFSYVDRGASVRLRAFRLTPLVLRAGQRSFTLRGTAYDIGRRARVPVELRVASRARGGEVRLTVGKRYTIRGRLLDGRIALTA